jgi:uncharacterized repeat protein (TIGR01451 family)/LPXTG-motif cell wall-anchored protein
MRTRRDGQQGRRARRSRRRDVGTALVVLGASAMVVGLTPSPASGLQEDAQQVALDPIGPPRYGGDRCPAEGHWWNFRLTPRDAGFGFARIDLDLAGTTRSFSGSQIVPLGGRTDDVLVEVPRGHGLDELRRAGSSALVTPGSAAVSPVFSLGFICYGPLAPRPTTTTSTVPEVPAPTVDGICYDVDVDGDVERYWHRITNDGDTAVDVAWSDGSATVPADGTVTVASADDVVTLSVGGDAVATTPEPPGEACVGNVRVTKRIAGPERSDGELAPVYTVQISRLVGATYLPEGPPFDVVGGDTVEIPLPSTFDPEGVQYRIEEIDPGDADAVSITPDTFVLNGHRTETVEVTIENAFAAIVLTKTVDRAIVAPGDELVYTLTAANTGGLTLGSVVVYDRLPVEVAFTGAAVAGGGGSCALVESEAPQLVRCDLADALAPGATTPAIRIAVRYTADDISAEPIINQAMAIGDFDRVRSSGIHAGATDADLTCTTTTGEVCDLAAAASGVLSRSVTTPTVVAQSPPTTVLSDAGAVTTVPFELPATGSTHGVLFVLGGLFVVVGIVLVLGTRRPSPTVGA